MVTALRSFFSVGAFTSARREAHRWRLEAKAHQRSCVPSCFLAEGASESGQRSRSRPHGRGQDGQWSRNPKGVETPTESKPQVEKLVGRPVQKFCACSVPTPCPQRGRCPAASHDAREDCTSALGKGAMGAGASGAGTIVTAGKAR